MKYFTGVTDLGQAKLRYRELAKQLHPDAGGTVVEFQIMQDEYRQLLLNFQQKQNTLISVHHPSSENELLNELKKLAKVLIKKQVPQNFLRRRMQTSESPLKKGLFGDIVDLLDSIE